MRISKRNRIPNATNNYMDIISNSEISAIFIFTRHDKHVEIAIEGIKANKAIFMEKPLAINLKELTLIEEALMNYDKTFMVGFNRRYSEHIQYIKSKLEKRVNPIVSVYRQNDKNYPKHHWIRGPEGGGIIIGHFCHIIDLFNYLIDAEIHSISGLKVNKRMQSYYDGDNYVLTLNYIDGSVINIVHTTLGSNIYPKDKCEIFYDGKVIELNNYQTTKIYSNNKVKTIVGKKDKGYYQEMVKFVDLVYNSDSNLKLNKKIINMTKLLFTIQNQFTKRSNFNITLNN